MSLDNALYFLRTYWDWLILISFLIVGLNYAIKRMRSVRQQKRWRQQAYRPNSTKTSAHLPQSVTEPDKSKPLVLPAAPSQSSTIDHKVDFNHYFRRPNLMSPAERIFFWALIKAVKPFLVAPKVRVADIINVPFGLPRHYLAKIAYKHFDFVVYDPSQALILAAVELDDASHSASKSIKNDDFKNCICDSVQLPLIRFKAQRLYDDRKINRQFEQAYYEQSVHFRTRTA